jgi:hypothetical protein
MADIESLRQIAHSRAPLSTWLGIVLLFASFGIIVLAVIGPTPRGSDYEEMRAKKRMENLKTAHEDAEKALNTYAWIDKNKGIARIPIDRAMELTVAQLAQQKPAPAGPIATPGPEAPAGGPASPARAGSPGAAPPGRSPSTQTPASPSPPAQQSPAPTSSPPAASPTPSPSKAP